MRCLSISAWNSRGEAGLLLFVTLNDHLTLALKSFTRQVEREREREVGGRGGAEGKPIHYKRDRGGEKGEQPEQETDGRVKRKREEEGGVCRTQFFRRREGRSEGCVPQG